jgi:hypothetical protein
LILTEGCLCIVRLDTGAIVRKRRLPFAGVPPALAGQTIVVQTGKRRLSAVGLSSWMTVWDITVGGEIVSNIVYDGGFAYVRVDTGRLLQIGTEDGRVVRAMALSGPR